ncbi:hypothetical protein LCGC14_1247550 [marine sediment metagenome]|uniref:Uncharacterized protein n=1 Tax=marine sediment metagenome TaxID=412755 RepID=A0A0F9NL98_9ZZZZ
MSETIKINRFFSLMFLFPNLKKNYICFLYTLKTNLKVFNQISYFYKSLIHYKLKIFISSAKYSFLVLNFYNNIINYHTLDHEQLNMSSKVDQIL